MSDIGAGGSRHILEPVEIRAPLLAHRGRIVEIALVELLDERHVGAEQVGTGEHALHFVHRSCLNRFS